MKKIQLTSLFILVLIAFSCKREILSNTISIQPLSNDLSYNKELNSVLQSFNSEDEVVLIKKIEYFGINANQFAIITFDTKFDKAKTYAIRKKFDTNGNFIGTETLICQGSCTNNNVCELVGVGAPFEPGSYIECSCSGCKMIIKQNDLRSDDDNSIYLNYANTSFEKTFGKKVVGNLSIKQITFINDVKADFQILTYVDKAGNESTTSFIRVKQIGVKANGVSLMIGKDFEVDCTGSCDCRERFFPATGVVECTCNECKMTVKEIKPVE